MTIRTSLAAIISMGLVGLVSPPISVAAGPSEPPADVSEPFRLLAGQLQSGRVMGLSDFAHHNAFAYHTLLQVLDHWVDRARADGGRLTLVLEADARMVEVLNDYLRTGDPEPVLDFWLPFSTLDQLEFYGRLRRFFLRVEELDRHRADDRRIRFRLLGPEQPSPLSTPPEAWAKVPNAADAGRVANDRDREIAASLLTDRRKYPGDALLVFYGTDHVAIRDTSNSWARRLFGATSRWRSMGSILKRELGTNYLGVAQMAYPPIARLANDPYRRFLSRDILLWAAEVPWKDLPQPPSDFDAVVFLHEDRIDEAHLLKFVCSRRIVQQAVTRLGPFEKLPRNALTTRHPAYAGSMEALRLTTGQAFETSSEWRAWASQTTYDGLDRVHSKSFAEAIRLDCAAPANRQRAARLASLGLPPTLYRRQQVIDADRWHHDLWPKIFPAVRFLQCLAIDWVGYPDEREKARAYLVEFAGRQLASPEAYLQWYRRHHLGLDY